MDGNNDRSSDTEEGYFSDDEEFHKEQVIAPGADALRPGIWPMNLGKSYVRGWDLQDAIRELLQNQKDGILASFKLGPRQYRAKLEPEKAKEIVVTIRHPSDLEHNSSRRKLLGYIRFDKVKGNIEFTNFKARLTAANLELGGTTKQGQKDLAGVHGEGFKVGALILSRHGYRVRYCTSSYYLNFGFKNKDSMTGFHCRVTEPKGAKLDQQRAKAASASSRPRTLTSHIWEDVSVTVGRVMGKGIKISKEDFLSWLKVSFDIEGYGRPANSAMIKTKYGDLVFDKEFSGAIYLKGIRLSSSSSSNDPLQYGYNFLEGKVNRDRQRLSNPADEADQFANIWKHAIQAEGDHVLQKYVNLLKDHPKTPDVHLAEKTVKEEIAKMVWQNLHGRAPNGFYFSEKSGAEDVELIRKMLNKDPIRLPESLWNLLRRFKLIQSPQEYLTEMFKNSEVSSTPDTPFSINIKRRLSAAMQLNIHTRNNVIVFVKGGVAVHEAIQLLFLPLSGVIKIHERWLDMKKIHEGASCDLKLMSDSMTGQAQEFTCQHVVEDLYEIALNDVLTRLDLGQSLITDLKKTLRSDVQIKLRQMPCVQLMQTDKVGELKVTWMDNESQMFSKCYGSLMKYVVILHCEDKCSMEREVLLYKLGNDQKEDINDQHTAVCGCPQQLVSQEEKQAIFPNLDPLEWYFPMVARHGDQTFYGLPPAAERPRSRAARATVSPQRPAANNVPSNFRYEAPTVESDDDDDSDVDMENSVENYNISPTLSKPAPSELSNLYDASPAPVSQARSVSTGRTWFQTVANDIEARSGQPKEDAAWKTWETTQLQSALQNFGRTRILKQQGQDRGGGYLFHEQLNCTIRQGEYYRLLLKTTQSPQKTMECIVFIHAFSGSKENASSVQLVVTKYSPATQIPAFAAVENPEFELILHFTNDKEMGTEHDAEVIEIGDIFHDAEHVGVMHMPEFPLVYVRALFKGDEAVEGEDFFCRFAVRNEDDSSSTCLTPIAAHLLQPKFRRKTPQYPYSSRPLVYDTTSNVLGACEGFVQAEFDVFAGFNFAKDDNMTWKARYQEASFYDTSPEATFEDFSNQKLAPPITFANDVPKVLLITGPNERFSLTGNKDATETSLKEFLNPLNNLSNSVLETLGGDAFVVVTMPSGILHEKAFPRLANFILTLLESGRSVNLRKIYLPDHGIPQDRTIIALIGSPRFAASPWVEPSRAVPVSIRDRIEDLSFANQRENMNGEISSICALPDGTANIYNHRTGYNPDGQVLEVVNFDATAIDFRPQIDPCYTSLGHPTRGDLLTIRELARLQGFPDDFFFFDKDHRQFQIALQALPPPIAKMIAQSVLTIVRAFEKQQPSHESFRGGAKRPRIESQG